MALALLGQEGCLRTATDATTTAPETPRRRDGRGAYEALVWPTLHDQPQGDATIDGARDAAVIVALEDYLNLPDVAGALANGRDWHRFLTRSLGVPSGSVALLSGGEATKEEIERQITAAASRAQQGGRVWFVFIGHGAPSRTRGGGLLVTYDAQRSADSFEARSLYQADVVARLEASNAHPVVVLDTCFSGQDSANQALLDVQPVTEASIEPGSRSIVLTAANSTEYAGPLPGLRRPAFSYLVLGAMRGWGDRNRDAIVTPDEAVFYAQDVMAQLVRGRTQTPGFFGPATPISLSRGFREFGPDIAEMARTGAGGSDVIFDTAALSAPDIDETAPPPLMTDINIPALEAYQEALKVQSDEDRDPREKSAAWCRVANITSDERTNPFEADARRLCTEWNDYAIALDKKIRDMERDYETLRLYLELEEIAATKEQKIALVSAFLGTYGDLGREYDGIREARGALRGLRTVGRASIPSLEHPSARTALSPSGSRDDLTRPRRVQRRSLSRARPVGWSMFGVGMASFWVGGMAMAWSGRYENDEEEKSVRDFRLGAGLAIAGLNMAALSAIPFSIFRTRNSSEWSRVAIANSIYEGSTARPRNHLYAPRVAGITLSTVGALLVINGIIPLMTFAVQETASSAPRAPSDAITMAIGMISAGGALVLISGIPWTIYSVRARRILPSKVGLHPTDGSGRRTVKTTPFPLLLPGAMGVGVIGSF